MVHVVVAPSSTPNVTFESRMFAPRAGVPEDPVCGSAKNKTGWSGEDSFEESCTFNRSDDIIQGRSYHVRVHQNRSLLSLSMTSHGSQTTTTPFSFRHTPEQVRTHTHEDILIR